MLFLTLMARVLQSLVLGVGVGVVGRWVVLGVGPRHSWLRTWWVALLVGLPVRPSGVSGVRAGLHPSWQRVRCAVSRRSFLAFVVGVGSGFLAISGVSGVFCPFWVVGCFGAGCGGLLCCVCLQCGRCSRFGVFCVFVALVLVAAVVVVVVCVACARVRVRCVGGVFLSPRKLHPLLEEKDPKNDRPKNFFFGHLRHT